MKIKDSFIGLQSVLISKQERECVNVFFLDFEVFSLSLCSDTVCDLGGASELANYGEYSGAPSESQTYEYAKTILKLMTEGSPKPDGKSGLNLWCTCHYCVIVEQGSVTLGRF